MRLTVLGATGRTGGELLKQALADGHAVTVLVRDAAKLGSLAGDLTVVTGSATDPAPVDKAIAGTDAVLSTLGHTADNPPDVMTQAMRNVIASMRNHGVKRLVVLANPVVRDAADRPTMTHRLMGTVFGLLIPKIASDQRGQGGLIRASGLDWTLVRPIQFNDAQVEGNVRVGKLDSTVGRSVRRAAVARFMLAAAVEGTYVGEMPLLSQ